MSKALVLFLVSVDVVIALSYLWSKDLARCWYWLMAGGISASTLFIR